MKLFFANKSLISFRILKLCEMVIKAFFFYFLSPLLSRITSASLIRLYHTDSVLIDGDYDCIYHYASFAEGRAKQLVSDCIRSSEVLMQNELSCHDAHHTFLSLRNANVTVNSLFDLQAPIDLISQYENYLTSGNGAGKCWCNCSQNGGRSFCTRCQYTFVFDANSFADVIKQIFTDKAERDARILTSSDFTCYAMYNCTTYTG